MAFEQTLRVEEEFAAWKSQVVLGRSADFCPRDMECWKILAHSGDGEQSQVAETKGDCEGPEETGMGRWLLIQVSACQISNLDSTSESLEIEKVFSSKK